MQVHQRNYSGEQEQFGDGGRPYELEYRAVPAIKRSLLAQAGVAEEVQRRKAAQIAVRQVAERQEELKAEALRTAITNSVAVEPQHEQTDESLLTTPENLNDSVAYLSRIAADIAEENGPVEFPDDKAA